MEIPLTDLPDLFSRKVYVCDTMLCVSFLCLGVVAGYLLTDFFKY